VHSDSSGVTASPTPPPLSPTSDVASKGGLPVAGSSNPSVPLTPYSYPTPTPPPGNVIGNLVMSGATTGWAQRLADGAVLHTTQGAQEWTVASPELPPGQQITAVAYVDGETARALSAVPTADPEETVVDAWSTGDGGVTWTLSGSLTVEGPLSAHEGGLDFVDADDGWWSAGVTAGAGNSEMTGMDLYRTTDGGASWVQVAEAELGDVVSGTISASCTSTTPPAALMDAASFIDGSTGWIAGECEGGVGVLFDVTHDGGQTWSPQSLVVPAAASLGWVTDPPRFTSGQDGVAEALNDGGGQPATLLITTDGGSSWTACAAPGEYSQSVDFVDPLDGWVLDAVSLNAGAAGEPDLYVTHDGGRTWTTLQTTYNPQPGVSAMNLGGLELDFVTTQLGFAAPPAVASFIAHDVLETSDGGLSWTQVTVQVNG
jgi:photosystem II stability/assembly factor-like uncharacterized protein